MSNSNDPFQTQSFQPRSLGSSQALPKNSTIIDLDPVRIQEVLDQHEKKTSENLNKNATASDSPFIKQPFDRVFESGRFMHSFLDGLGLSKDQPSHPSISETMADRFMAVSARKHHQPKRIHQEAAHWIKASYAAEEHLAACPDYTYEAPIKVHFSAAEHAHYDAVHAESLARRFTSFAALTVQAFAHIGSHILPSSTHPLLGRIKDQVSELEAHFDQPIKDHQVGFFAHINTHEQGANREMAITGPLLRSDYSDPYVTLSSAKAIFSVFTPESFKSRGWSEPMARTFTILHEFGHALHFRRSANYSALMGIDTISDPQVAQTLKSLIFPTQFESSEPEKNTQYWETQDSLPKSKDASDVVSSMGGQTYLHTNAKTSFEEKAKSILLESYADCFAAITMGHQNRSLTRRVALDILYVRDSNIPKDVTLKTAPFDSLSHDTREALKFLSERMTLEDPLALKSKPLEGFDAQAFMDMNVDAKADFRFSQQADLKSIHDLAMNCAVHGLSRWICQMATQPTLQGTHDQSEMPVHQYLYMKLASLNQQKGHQELNEQKETLHGFSEKTQHNRSFQAYWDALEPSFMQLKPEIEDCMSAVKAPKDAKNADPTLRADTQQKNLGPVGPTNSPQLHLQPLNTLIEHFGFPAHPWSGLRAFSDESIKQIFEAHAPKAPSTPWKEKLYSTLLGEEAAKRQINRDQQAFKHSREDIDAAKSMPATESFSQLVDQKTASILKTDPAFSLQTYPHLVALKALLSPSASEGPIDEPAPKKMTEFYISSSHYGDSIISLPSENHNISLALQQRRRAQEESLQPKEPHVQNLAEQPLPSKLKM